MKQVDKKEYNFNDYGHIDRWASYHYQIKEVLYLAPHSILEIGVGDKVFGEYIKNNTNISYKSLDVAEDLKPDIVGSILNIPLGKNSFDAVCAFEVLEHLEFEKFETALSELKKVSKKYVVLSLPHFGPVCKFFLKIPFLKEIKFSCKLPFPKRHVFNGQHYWEIGKRGFGQGKVRGIIKKHFRIVKEFVPFESQYHHFYVLEKM